MGALQNTNHPALIPLTDAASIVTDANLGRNFSVTLAGNRTLAAPLNVPPNTILRWLITQDATGTRTLAYNAAFKWAGGTAPVLSTIAARVDMIEATTLDGVTFYGSARINVT